MASGAEPNWQILVAGYEPAEVLQSLVPASFRFDDHPEISRNPPAVLRPRDTAVNPGDGSNGPKPCATTVCVSPSYYRALSGKVALRNSNGSYYLPNGSKITKSSAMYSGADNSGVIEGYWYTGADQSQWFAGSNNAGNPITQDQFQTAQDSWYSANTSPC